MNPPNTLRRAAALLEQAKQSPDRREVERLLAESLALTRAVSANIESVLAPDIEQIGAGLRARYVYE